jgi:putative transposase
MAIDFTLIPYHGLPARQEREIRRGQPKHGTTHFHAYATAYVVQHGQRYTLAATWVLGDEDVKSVVQRLLQRVRRLGVKIRLLLVDKEFFNVEVVRYLQAARLPFLMPAFARGRQPRVPKPHSLHQFASCKRGGGWGRYRWSNRHGRRATVHIAIVCRNYRGHRGRHGRRVQLYAYWGLRPGSLRWVHDTYRQRFGIESSYRQLHECRIRTSTRKPLLRLLYVGLALILRNVWVWCHLNWLAIRRGPGIFLREHLLPLREMTLWLQHLVALEFGLVLIKLIPTLDDPNR